MPCSQMGPPLAQAHLPGPRVCTSVIQQFPNSTPSSLDSVLLVSAKVSTSTLLLSWNLTHPSSPSHPAFEAAEFSSG